MEASNHITFSYILACSDVQDAYNALHSSGALYCVHVGSQGRANWPVYDRRRVNFPLCFIAAALTKVDLCELEEKHIHEWLSDVNGSERVQKYADRCAFGGVSFFYLAGNP